MPLDRRNAHYEVLIPGTAEHWIGGTLRVTPMRPTSPTTFEPAGDPVDGLVFEVHRGTLGERSGPVTEYASQLLLGSPAQSLRWRFASGFHDCYARKVLCGGD